MRKTNRGFSLIELPVARKRKRAAFSLIELLVVIGIIGVLIAILLPSLRVARLHAQRIQCMNNMRQIGLGFIMYDNTYHHLPLRVNPASLSTPENYWGYDEELIQLKACVADTFICPSHPDAGFHNVPSQPSYGMNWYYDNQPISKAHPNVILAAEVLGPDGTGSHRADRDSIDPGELAPHRHRNRSNYLFFDGHVDWMTYEQASGDALQNWGEDQGSHG